MRLLGCIWIGVKQFVGGFGERAFGPCRDLFLQFPNQTTQVCLRSTRHIDKANAYQVPAIGPFRNASKFKGEAVDSKGHLDLQPESRLEALDSTQAAASQAEIG